MKQKNALYLVILHLLICPQTLICQQQIWFKESNPAGHCHYLCDDINEIRTHQSYPVHFQEAISKEKGNISSS